jgi:hypothetical protein
MSLTPDLLGILTANADDASHTLIEKWGGAVVSEPKHSEERGWHIEVVGLLGDIHMDTVVVYSNGARELLP